VHVIIALMVTPEGLPLAYEVLPGNTADNTTLKAFLARIEAQDGKARRIWLMDRGVPTEAVLTEMRAAEPPVQYLVGTSKGRLTRLEKALVAKPWQELLMRLGAARKQPRTPWRLVTIDIAADSAALSYRLARGRASYLRVA
jgi:hypothetical protein